jgi:hypothetical protein
MTVQRPLIVSGTARGGTNLIVMAASVHPSVSLVQDPYLGLYKRLRASTRRAARTDDREAMDAPLDEYYFFDRRLEAMDLIQAASLDIEFDQSFRESLILELKARMGLSAPLLIPHVDGLQGRTYREMFESAIDLIARARPAPDLKWVGFNDNWTAEFFRPLARAFPEARFVLIVRDVRAAVASHLRLVEAKHINPLYQYDKKKSMIAMTLSFVRCWRKQVAFACDYATAPDMQGRVCLMTYEGFVEDPEEKMRALCRFLDIDYRDEMIDTSCFISGDGNPWLPNSNHGDVPATGIYADTVDRWRTSLPKSVLELVELVAGPDLRALGYSVDEADGSPAAVARAFDRHSQELRDWEGGSFGWRTDNDNAEIDIGLELLRRQLLATQHADPSLVRRCFLFERAYSLMRDGAQLELR